MATVTIRKGDCVTSIAHARGFDPKILWDHPDNADLKEQRHTPQALAPGDLLAVPDLEESEEPVSTGSVGRFKLSVGPVHLRLRLTLLGEPRAEETYELSIQGEDAIDGCTDGDGWLDEPIPPTASTATLSLRDGKELYTLHLGHLDPHDSDTGVQHRLGALGFYFGKLDGKHDVHTEAALRRFQTKNGLSVTGRADDATVGALRDAYGC